MFLKKNLCNPPFKTQSGTFIVSWFFAFWGFLWLFLIFQTWHFKGATLKSTHSLDMSDKSHQRASSQFCTCYLFSVWFRIFFCLWGKTSYSVQAPEKKISLTCTSLMQREEPCSGENGVVFTSLWCRGSFIDFPRATSSVSWLNIWQGQTSSL